MNIELTTWRRVILFVLISWILLFQLNFTSDGERYYAYMRSLFFDHDLNFYNEYTFFTFLPAARKSKCLVTTDTGYIWNPFSVGPSLLWSPFFFTGHLVGRGLSLIHYPVLTNGYSLPYTMSVALGTLFYCILGLWANFQLCRIFSSPRYSALALTAGFFASPLPGYVFLEPAYSHSMSYCMVSLFLLLWIKTGISPVQRDRWGSERIILLSLIAGLASLVRWQNCVIMVALPFEFFFWHSEHAQRSFRNRLKTVMVPILLGMIGFFVMLTPQFLTWKTLFGSFFTVPQGESFMHWLKPALGQVLWSPLNGLFTWHPLFLIGFISLLWLAKRNLPLSLTGLFFFACQWYINGAVDDWFAGAAFGNRRFINCLPFMAVALSYGLEKASPRFRRWFIGILASLIVWNGVLLCRNYYGDLRGLTALRWDKMFQTIERWPSFMWQALQHNFFIRMLFHEHWSKPYSIFAFLVACVLALFILFSFFNLLQQKSAILFSRIRQVSLLMPTVIVSLILSVVGIDMLLIRFQMEAQPVASMHLGNDAPGRIVTLNLSKPESYMGSYSPIHLKPGEEHRFTLEVPQTAGSLLVVATLSGSHAMQRAPEDVMLIKLEAFDKVRESVVLSYPRDIDRMDRDEYSPFSGERAPISSSWFFPEQQKKPHHWYSKRIALHSETLVTAVHLKNMSRNMTLHLTGIAFTQR